MSARRAPHMKKEFEQEQEQPNGVTYKTFVNGLEHSSTEILKSRANAESIGFMRKAE